MNITNQELRQRLLALGYNAPPVTTSSRNVLLKKLQTLEGQSATTSSLPVNNSVQPSSNYSSPPNNSNSPQNNSSSSPNNVNDVERQEVRTRKTRSARTQELPGNSFFDSSPPRQTRSRTEENNYDKVDAIPSIKKTKTSTPFSDSFSRPDPFERGSDSDDSVSRSARSTLARKPIGIRRESQYYSNRTPTVYRSFDSDNGAASYLNRDIHRPKSKSNTVAWYQRLHKKIIPNSFNNMSSCVLLAFAVIVGTIVFTYFIQNDRQYGEVLLDDIKYLKCNDRSSPNEPCIPDEEVEGSLRSLQILYQELWQMEVDQVCGGRTTAPNNGFLPSDNFTELLVSKNGFLRFDAGKMNNNVKMLTKRNPQIGLVFRNTDGFKLEKVDLPWKCLLGSFFFNLFQYVTYFVLTAFFILSIEILRRWWFSRYLKYAKEKQDLLKNIVETLQQNAITNPSQPYLPIVHVRDQIISYQDRENKKKMWIEAVKFIEENESRIRKEIQPYQGEDYEVWRWLGENQSSLPKPKTWHGEAFETSRDTMNTPSTSPTPCLKIRNMFDPKNEADNEDWVTGVKDAILERCEGVNVTHMVVDETNPEGCVYIKCASTDDAGKAYRKMHGAWFDGKIVSVKYLRLERYHERYPASIGLTQNLIPSNDQRKSII